MDEANRDFDAKGPIDVVPLPGGGRRGTLPDGRQINVRPDSSAGVPTLEIQEQEPRQSEVWPMKFTPIFQEHVRDGHWELEQLVDRGGALVLTLSDDRGRRTKVSFDSYMAYRKLDEGDALLTLAAMRKTGGTAKYFYLVDESSFIAWFDKDRCNDGSVQALVHCTIAADNDIVDIIALDLPVVEAE